MPKGSEFPVQLPICKGPLAAIALVGFGLVACLPDAPVTAPKAPTTPALVLLSEGIEANDFPPIFDPALWDLDPEVGNAIEGSPFAPDGGRRQGILQLFIFNSLNLELFVNQKLREIVDESLANDGNAVRLTQTGPDLLIRRTLRQTADGVTHEGELLVGGTRVLSFVHNLTTQAFDGEYASPVDSNTRHRAIVAPLANGNFVFGSAYDLLDNGRANYTHIGLVDSNKRPIRLLEFFQINRAFDETARDLEQKVAREVAAAGDKGNEVVVQMPDVIEPEGATGDPPAVVAPEEEAFPPLLDRRFFQLDLAAVGSPGNSGNIFRVVNAVGRNAVLDLQPLVDNAKVTFEEDDDGRLVEVRSGVIAGTHFESRQTFEGGVQEGVAFVNRRKRLQFIRDHESGSFHGIIIAPSFDLNAPLCAIVTPNPNGTATHLIIEDLANNLKNDYRAELRVDTKTLRPLEFIDFQQFNGGLAAQSESANLVQTFGFEEIVKGF